MNITRSLLYLLLLYAVLDKGNNLSLTNGLIIAFVILLLNCYCSRYCLANSTNTASNTVENIFSSLNGF